MECPSCRNDIPLENVGTAIIDTGEDEIICHHCGAHLAVTLEIVSR